ncbi:LysM peptidoglycan-binding domain-containing protein [Niveibacterium sp. 24ML]|uniref:FimV/HubP family polar landmark protein n=1 Tax=Niveibacterium sp. 24ML TaxID=2985512 RepID=UPI002270E5AD|nr:FimV/HubP family polar landmark protein [Niveibacterium sp. 24ML]MCX9155133.1 LysM peptidoglycan-binding domain-containing protein [Niveibacterium sp. 24ML]
MSARLASPEAFRRANIEYAPQLTGLRLTVEKRGSGAIVKVTSDRAFSEPFVDMLLELNWTGGRLLREYTFLLDPVDEGGKAAVQQVAPPVTRQLEPKPTSSKRKERDAAAAPQAEQAAKAPAVPAKPKEPFSGTEYTVKAGDSLTAIAARTKAADVSLEQMLAALYSANPTAFAAGDINRLRTGDVLKVPEAAAAKEVAPADARKILSAPSANFGAYRQKAGAAVAEGAEKEIATKQSASGKVTPKVEDAAKAQDSKDKLKISKSQVAKDTAAVDPKVAGRVQALEEDLVARERALKEANERVAALEKNVKDLQKLVDLKNQNLADLQKQAVASKGDAAKAQKEVVAPIEPAKPAPVAEASAPVAQSEVAPVAETAAASEAPVVKELPAEPAPVVEASPVKPATPVAAPPAEPVVEEPGFFASMAENPAILGGLAAVLGLGGFLAYRSRRQKKSSSPDTTALNATQTGTESVIGPVGGQTVDTGSSVLPTDFSQSGLTSIDADEGVDPVAEADVYMAYGRDAQAEEILLDALKSDPSRTAIHVKLLEIYSQRKSHKQFENIATDLYTQTGGVGADWMRAADLGSKLDPDNPLYRTTGKAPVAAAAAPVMLDELSFVEASNPTPSVPTEPIQDFAAVETEIEPPEAFEFTSEPLAQAPASTPAFATASPSQMQTTWTMPGEIGQITRTLDGEASSVGAATQGDAASSDDLGLDFNLDLDMEPGGAAPDPVVVPGAVPELAPDELSKAEVKLTSTNIGSATEAPITLDLDGFNEAPALNDDVAVASAVDAQHEALVDLEKTNFEGGLLDFDFDVDRSPQTESLAAKPAPMDLSGIDLELPKGDVPQSQVDTHPEPLAMDDDFEMGDEVNTKLELARAYEEMRDFEGARELLEEVLKEGSGAQRDEAEAMMARIST